MGRDDAGYRKVLAVLLAVLALIRIHYYLQAARRGNGVDLREGGLTLVVRTVVVPLQMAAALVYLLSPRRLAWSSLPLPAWLRWMGGALGGLSMVLLLWTHRTLGSNFSDTLHTASAQNLVTAGPYRWVRHPMYTAFFLMTTAFFLVSANWLAGALWIGGVAAVVANRVRREEELMVERFGDGYRDYMRRTGRFLPHLLGQLHSGPNARRGSGSERTNGRAASESLPWLLLDAWRARREGPTGLERRQRARLAEMVAFARAHSPYYRALYKDLPETVEDPVLLPVTDKKTLMARFDDWVTDRAVTIEKARPFVENPDLFGKQFLGKYIVITTSGTTGTHGIFLSDKRSDSVTGPLFLRMMSSWLGARDIIRIIAGGGRIASVLAIGTPTATGVGISRFGPRLGKAFQALSVHAPLPELVAALDAFQPLILTSYGTVTKLLAAEQEAGRLHIHPVLVLLTAEGLPPDEYGRIARVFKTKVANSYAASECFFISSNCEHGWLHVNSDWVVLEPVDADYRPVPPGVQSHTVLISNLANRVQPILRYDLGDSILQRPDPCRCGDPRPAIRVQGRAADLLTFPTDRGDRITMPPLLFGTSIYHIPGIEQFQVVQVAPAVLRVRLRLAQGADAGAVWQAVHAQLTR
ncbi:MAG: isoprenylcysteine carboxylmethyltransferase family protein, partial [Dehalococcoidales bacterium]|nr:isoprenylcysteine carboxylmethyltransferase family protein [Dehalococcoidales bacterium]